MRRAAHWLVEIKMPMLLAKVSNTLRLRGEGLRNACCLGIVEWIDSNLKGYADAALRNVQWALGLHQKTAV
jgi:hypothetical protein